MNELLAQQLRDATTADGQLDTARLLTAIERTYQAQADERRGAVRSMQLMSDAANALTRELRESNASQLQAILDNVKDAVLTLDADGHVLSLNAIGQRIFGRLEAEVIGRGLEFLLPNLQSEALVAELDALSEQMERTQVDLTPRETLGLRSNDTCFHVEMAVTKTRVNRRNMYVVCLRDTSERRHAEQALRDSEARYRTLVEHAPETIMVFDAERMYLTEVNENAVRLFKQSRLKLLSQHLHELSPERQPDGRSSNVALQLEIQRALAGEAPVFEWTYRDGGGTDIACEVRLVRLPSSNGNLIRGSITDITERKRSELLAVGEKRVFERLAAQVDLSVTLATITEMVEKVSKDALCAISLLDERGERLHLNAAPSFPEVFTQAMHSVACSLRNGSCAAAVYLRRQVIVADIGRDAFWENRRQLALSIGLRACWSTLIYAADGRELGTVAWYFKEPRQPVRRDFDLMMRIAQLAGLAIERHRSQEALRDSELRYRRLFDNVVEGVYSATLEGRFLSVNPALQHMVGAMSEAELLALPTEKLYADPLARFEIISAIARDGEVRDAEFQLRRLDGTTLTVVENTRAVRDELGRLIGFEGTISDISARKRAEMAVFSEKEKAQVTLQSIGDAVITTDANGCIEYLNPVAQDLTGWETHEVQGKALNKVFRIMHESLQTPLEDPVAICLREGQVVNATENSVLINRRGQEIAIENSAAPIRDRGGQVIGAVMVFHDVSKERRLRRALAYQANHDALTGLINRREFENRLNMALLAAQANAEVSHVLMYLDLDQFKVVNDTCGHQAGDRLLKQVTGLLQTRLRSTDVIARLGGDEFGILLDHCSTREALPIAESLRQAIRDYRFIWKDGALNVGVSIGFVEINHQSESIVSVMSAADVACYAAKDSGRNRVHAYRPGEVPQHHREMQWVSRITRACEDNRLELFYQPIVAIGDNVDHCSHFELLLRMRDENGQLVPPSEFLPAAERYNLMPVIDRWVVQQALATLAHKSADDVSPGTGEVLSPYSIAINLSGTSLNDDRFLEFVLTELQNSKPSDGAVCFEITETAAIANLAKVVHFMRELKARGCLFSLDDFGSGLSSFMYLKNLPVDYLKIDGQFIQQVCVDPVDRSMVTAISQIGKVMGIKTIAERVESEQVLNTLAEIGIEYAQGYYIAEPHPVESLSRLISGNALIRLRQSA
jgi:diguanylate cyclase (GGDEF)-like protein/PAS domain S-box-containing protein